MVHITGLARWSTHQLGHTSAHTPGEEHERSFAMAQLWPADTETAQIQMYTLLTCVVAASCITGWYILLRGFKQLSSFHPKLQNCQHGNI